MTHLDHLRIQGDSFNRVGKTNRVCQLQQKALPDVFGIEVEFAVVVSEDVALGRLEIDLLKSLFELFFHRFKHFAVEGG